MWINFNKLEPKKNFENLIINKRSIYNHLFHGILITTTTTKKVNLEFKHQRKKIKNQILFQKKTMRKKFPSFFSFSTHTHGKLQRTKPLKNEFE